MAKVKDNVWTIFTNSVILYFQNFGSFFKYMAFPVLGQVFGIVLAFFAAFWFAANLPNWAVKGSLLDNFSVIFILLMLIILPGLLIFAKAFWDYLVAYGAINSMLENLLKSGKVYDFPAHNEVILRKSFKFVGLWLVIGLLSMLGSFPLIWVIAAIMFVYFILVFQIFVFEPQQSIYGCFKRSVEIIKGNFARTVGLAALIGAFTYWILPKGLALLFGLANILTFLAIPFDFWAKQLPIPEINSMIAQSHLAFRLTSLMVADFIVMLFINYVVIGLTLPMRTICWGLWYKALAKPEKTLDKKIIDKAEGKD